MLKEKYTRAPEAEDELTYSEEMAQQSPQPVEELSAEEESYKKRYQDIQRHIQTVRDQKDEEVNAVKRQLNAATRQLGQIAIPMSPRLLIPLPVNVPTKHLNRANSD